ncbi:MAG: histidinol-phosphatase [Spirochaetaceae bacterium]|jgi:histidinol-phosphatase (PHP family)|nr:histidinol-phosphatase [Spirochaetaceae bacterium]
MTYSCLHTHTTFCDGEADVHTMCAAAFAKGFESIGFSSHGPVTKKTGLKTGWHLPDHRLDEYIDTIRREQKLWEGKLTVYLGLEVDFIQGLCGPADADIQALPLDYIIGAVHYVLSPRNGEPFAVDSPPEEFKKGLADLFDAGGTALYNRYYDAYGQMIRAGGCDILAHLDLVKKNNRQFQFFSPAEGEYLRRVEETADLAAAAQGGSRSPVVEVNTGGIIRGRTADTYPSLEIQRLLKKRHVPLTINADAHGPDHLGGAYETARETMINAGYTSMWIFHGRKDQRALWQEEAL